MILPRESIPDKRRILTHLYNIYRLEENASKYYNFKKRYFRHNRVINYTTIFCIIISILIFLILKIISIFKIHIIIRFEISLFISILAFIISVITLFINLVKLMDYPVQEFTIKKIFDKEDFYELKFSITNSGHGKLKLDFAAYFIEEFNENSKLDSFLYCDTENISQYLGELLNRIKSKVVKVYSLNAITKDFNVFFPHNNVHSESRLHKFDKNKIYMITFFFQTSHKIFFYAISHLIT